MIRKLTKENASEMARKKWSNKTPEERKEHAIMMNKKRWDAYKLIKQNGTKNI